MGSIRELWDNMVAKLNALGKGLLSTPEMDFMEQLKEAVHELEKFKVDAIPDLVDQRKLVKSQAQLIDTQNAALMTLRDRVGYLENYIIPEGATEMIDLVVAGLKEIVASGIQRVPDAEVKPDPLLTVAAAANDLQIKVIEFKKLPADDAVPAADNPSPAAAIDASVGPRGHA